MALGGGIFITQNKVLPGSYINFVSAAKASSNLSARGFAAIPFELDWGVDGDVFAVEAADFQKNSLKIFGYEYTNDKLKGLRDLFKNLKTGYFFKLNTGGVKAACTYARALYTGTKGNDLKIVIEHNEAYTAENTLFDVTTYYGTVKVDFQTVLTMGALKKNDFVEFVSTATLTLTAGTPLTGGTNGTVQDATYQTFLDKIESYSFNTLGCLSTNDTIRGLFANFTKRMRDEVGVKFQCVLFRYTSPDHEGVISVENNLSGLGETLDPSAIYWVLGAEAGCDVNKSNTNKTYDGEFTIDVDYTQTQLETGIKTGKFMFHKVGDKVRVLEDINTFVSVTDQKSSDFNSNQTIRILDQIGTDIAALFNAKYLGNVPNDAAGRISLWGDVVKHHQELEKIRAIENFAPEKVIVEQGETKKAVVIQDVVTPVNAMEQLYMTVVVQ